MIIKGTSSAGPVALAAHLGNAEKNERVSLLETRGTIAQDLRGALVEMDAYAAGTRCQKSLYHAAISPEPPHRLTPEQRTEAIDALEKKLGLDGHARVVVMHEKLGREHVHIVWSRIDLDKMRTVSDSHNYRKHEEVARDLERRFGHDRVQGAHAERDGVERPDRTPSRAELRQEERTGIKGKDVKAEVTAAFRASDNAEAFCAALDDAGYVLAKGDRRDFVVVDRAGGIHSLARRIDGIKAAELREFMKPVARDSLPSAQQARDAQLERQVGRESALDQSRWEAALAASAIKKVQADEVRQQEMRKARKEAHKDALIERGYGKGEDYVSQTTAAQNDHERRSKLRSNQPRPAHPSEHGGQKSMTDFEGYGRDLTESDQVHETDSLASSPVRDSAIGQTKSGVTRNQAARERYDRMEGLLYGDAGHKESEQHRAGEEAAKTERERRERLDSEARSRKNDAPMGAHRERGPKEVSDEQYARMQRRLNEEKTGFRDWDDFDLDRQQEAPGGGRTRSR